ncbi:hypothetical protein [Psychrobacter sp. I-STPA10]|uniref:hypothetical protein n=1 Tax=Psychrobacter sp. I-STPA10 TaxID=2585769 RepID=UPI001E4A74C5|nr:hypothetical protein [Psychrobacter sp. I-STPA10]
MKKNFIKLKTDADEIIKTDFIDEFIRLVETETISVECLIMPSIKSYWQKSAMVICSLDDKYLDQVYYYLLQWIMDLNWPGACEIFHFLTSKKALQLDIAFEKALKNARFLEDVDWLDNLSYLQEARHHNSF